VRCSCARNAATERASVWKKKKETILKGAPAALLKNRYGWIRFRVNPLQLRAEGCEGARIRLEKGKINNKPW